MTGINSLGDELLAGDPFSVIAELAFKFLDRQHSI